MAVMTSVANDLLEAKMMQAQIFIPVAFARKCEVNMISTLHLLRFWYFRKSTNLTYIYTYLLSLQSVTFTFSTKSSQTWCEFICLHHCLHTLPRLQIRTFALVLLRFRYRSKYAHIHYVCITIKLANLPCYLAFAIHANKIIFNEFAQISP